MTVAAADGSAPPGLSPSDLVVKESGRPRPIVRVEPSRATLQVAIVVEEQLTPDNEVRRSIAHFIDQIRESGQLALYVVGRRSERRVDYTSEIVPFASAINRFPSHSTDKGDIVQALHEIARDQRPREGRRAIVVVAVQGAAVSNVSSDAVLDQLRAGAIVLYAATLWSRETSTTPLGETSGGRRLDLEGQVSGLERDKVFNDATRQSGGLHLASQRTAGLWSTLERIAGELTHQYVVSYEGDPQSDGSIAVEPTRRDIVLRAAARVK